MTSKILFYIHSDVDYADFALDQLDCSKKNKESMKDVKMRLRFALTGANIVRGGGGKGIYSLIAMKDDSERSSSV